MGALPGDGGMKCSLAEGRAHVSKTGEGMGASVVRGLGMNGQRGTSGDKGKRPDYTENAGQFVHFYVSFGFEFTAGRVEGIW